MLSTGLLPISQDISVSPNWDRGNAELVHGWHRAKATNNEAGPATCDSVVPLNKRSCAGFYNRTNDGQPSQGGATVAIDYGYEGGLSDIQSLMGENGYVKQQAAYGFTGDIWTAPELFATPNQDSSAKTYLELWEVSNGHYLPPNQNPKRRDNANSMNVDDIPVPTSAVDVEPPNPRTEQLMKFGSDDPNPIYPLAPMDPVEASSTILASRAHMGNYRRYSRYNNWNGTINENKDCTASNPEVYIPPRPGRLKDGSASNAAMARVGILNAQWNRAVNNTQ